MCTRKQARTPKLPFLLGIPKVPGQPTELIRRLGRGQSGGLFLATQRGEAHPLRCGGFLFAGGGIIGLASSWRKPAADGRGPTTAPGLTSSVRVQGGTSDQLRGQARRMYKGLLWSVLSVGWPQKPEPEKQEAAKPGQQQHHWTRVRGWGQEASGWSVQLEGQVARASP